MKLHPFLQFILIMGWVSGTVIAEHLHDGDWIIAMLCPFYAWYRLMEHALLYFNVL
jgi:hypothetical protein